MENQNLEDKEFADAMAALAGQGNLPPPGQPAEPEPVTPPAEPEPTEPPVEPADPNAPPPAEPKKPAAPPEPTEPAPPPAEPELILGKFKTQEDLVKAYQNLESAFGKKSTQVKETEIVAMPDEIDAYIDEMVGNSALKSVEAAISTITNPEHLKEATLLVAQAKRTGDVSLIEQARGFLDRTVDRRLDREIWNNSAQIKQTILAKRDEIEMEPVKEQILELHKEDPDWVKDEHNQAILDLTISLNRKVDLKEVKKMIVEVGNRAVEKYKNAEAAKAAKVAAKTPNPSLAAGGRTPPPPPAKSEDEMTTAEYLEAQYAKLAAK